MYIQRAIISVKYIYTGTIIIVYIRIRSHTVRHTVVMSHVDSTRCMATIYIIDLHTLHSFCAEVDSYVNTVYVTTDGSTQNVAVQRLIYTYKHFRSFVGSKGYADHLYKLLLQLLQPPELVQSHNSVWCVSKLCTYT